MTPEELDRLLAEWKNLLDIASQNLIELQDLPTYQRLVGSRGYRKVELVGVSAKRVIPALEAMNELFEHFDLLSQTVDKANDLRLSLPRFLASEQKINEIKHLLVGASIHLPAMKTPLAQRGLLTAAETKNAITPKQLLQVMNDAFSVARDAVLSIEAIWTQLDTNIYSAYTELKNLENVFPVDEIQAIRHKIDLISQSVETDPLGVIGDWEQEVNLPLKKLKADLENKLRQQTQAKEKLAKAQQLFEELTEIHKRAKTTFAERQEKIVEYHILHNPLPDEQITALGEWLARLDSKFALGLVNPVMVGLENLIKKIKEYIDLEKLALETNQAALDMRCELRGRLDALSAKALARGLAEHTVLSEIAQQAKQLLYSRPTPLNKAIELVSLYEKHCRAIHNS